MTATLNQIPASDADGDINSLSDLLGGTGASDPNEGAETDEQLINVGGKGEDLRALAAVHDPGMIPTLSASTSGALAASIGAMAAATRSATNVAGMIVGTFVVGVAGYTEINSVVQNQQLKNIQTDPFDSNFKQVFSPVFLPVPAVPTLPASVPAAIATTLQSDGKALLTDEGSVSSYAQAVYVTQNRLFSAYQMGDLNSFDIQNTALNKYAAALASFETAQGQAETALINDLVKNGVDVTFTRADVISFQNNLKSKGFAALPAQEQATVQNYFQDTAGQQAIVNDLIQVDPNTVPLTFVTALQMEDSASMAIGGALTLPPLTNTTVPPLSTNFTEVDTSTNTASQTNGTPYSGPVAGVQWEDIHITSDNLNITANVPNVFLHSGAGEDALQVVSGTNVMDGGTGSNFLTGGSGTDTFFVDDRAATADIWSTVVNFHAGDAATIWGVTPQDFGLAFADGQGAAGFTGLTLHATAPGKPIASLTLAGFATADLSSGRLSISFGTVGDSSYMYVQANS